MSTVPSSAGERRAIVDRARKSWITRLIDLSRRNNLLFYRPLKTGSLELQIEAALDDLFQEKSIPLARIIGAQDPVRAAAVVSEIDDRARSNREERGLETLFLTIGMATWEADDGGRPYEAPVILLPITIEWSGRDRSRPSFRRSGDPQVNIVLVHALTSEYGCAIDAETLLPDSGDDELVDTSAVFEKLRSACRGLRSFCVMPRGILGNFAFQKLAMVRDIKDHGDAIAAHDVIAALAGDTGARAQMRPNGGEPDPREFDAIEPDAEHLILDSDSSQMQAIACALGREHVVIQGPPGSGKSQTIANLIAACAATGKSVLFVAEKRAALEAVHKRLEQVGLGHLALDVHGADVSKKQIMERIRDRLELLRGASPVATDHIHPPFVERRARLVDHARRMHLPRPPSGRSVFKLQGALLALRDSPTQTRIRGSTLDGWTEAELARCHSLVRGLGAFDSFLLGIEHSAWVTAKLDSGIEAQTCVDAATELHREALRTLVRGVDEYVATRGVSKITGLEPLSTALAVEREIGRFLARHEPTLFELDLKKTEGALTNADKNAITRSFTWLFRPPYRRALRDVRTRSKDRKLSSHSALHAVRSARELAKRWSAIGGASPITSSCDLRKLEAHEERVRALLRTIDSKLDGVRLEQSSFGDMDRVLCELVERSSVAVRVPAYRHTVKQITDAGFGAFIEELRTQQVPAPLWNRSLDHCIAASLLDRVRVDDSSVAGFSGKVHTGIGRDFSELDRQRIRVAAGRVRRAHAELAIASMDEHPAEDQLVRTEARKKKKHMALRRLLAGAPHVLTKLCPCWMGSPLSVSHLFGPQSRWFDVVVFDEASQVLPEDAIPAIMRASQIVVAGDRHQLPPTTFFADGGGAEDDSDEEENDAAGFESLLDLMSASSARSSMLRWHYRSRSESLIAFSNANIYDSRLITFPDVGGGSSVRHVHVQATQPAGSQDSASAEVARVVDLVFEHAQQRSDQSLGVITLGITHAQRIEAAIRVRQRARPDLDEFFNPQRPERFFVKNLERVQGDERDAIIISIGLQKDAAGVLLNRLGPLNQQGGERRLNVAVTRARSSLTLVSSFAHHDMDPSRFRAPGAEMLRKYVEYAASGGRIMPDHGSTGFAPNDFEADVQTALESRGIRVVPQWGTSSYRLDLVAQHPSKPGRFVLAIECDGASYHSGNTARERDRLRQQHLESLGWRFHRIWSTDWFNERDVEIERAVTAFQEAVRAVDLDVQVPVPRHETGPTTDHGTAMEGQRGKRPSVYPGRAINEYSDFELIKLVRWIASDHVLRTEDEMLDAMVDELGFARRGSRIVERLRAVIDAWSRERSS